MQEIDTLIFDLDGTLVDTRPHTAACVNYALTQIGERQIEVETITKLIGPTLADTFNAILDFSKWSYIDTCIELYKTYQKEHPSEAFREVRLYPTVKKTLQKLSNYNLVVATSKPAWLASQILSLVGLKQYFSTVVGVDEVPKNKPAPDMIYLALSRVHSSGTAMIIGDSIGDIHAGRTAQILTCAVEYGYTDREKLEEANPDFLISRFDDLLKVLR